MVYRRGLLGNRRKYTQSTSDWPTTLDQIKASGVKISTRYIYGNPNPEKTKTTTVQGHNMNREDSMACLRPK